MEPLLDRLFRLLHRHYSRQRSLLLAQSAAGKVAWLRQPEDMPLSLRLNAHDTVSLTLGQDDPGRAFLAELKAGRGSGFAVRTWVSHRAG